MVGWQDSDLPVPFQPLIGVVIGSVFKNKTALHQPKKHHALLQSKFHIFLTPLLNLSSQACLLTSSLVTLATALPSPATGVLRYSYQPFKQTPFKCSKGRSTRKSRLKIPQTGLGVSIQGERDENFDFHLNRTFQEWSWLQCKGRPGA